MSRLTQVQIRCDECNRRLADRVNEIEAGQVLVELKCPRCGQSHLEVIRTVVIAGNLNVSEATVKTHLHNVYGKLKLDGRVALTVFAREKGLV